MTQKPLFQLPEESIDRTIVRYVIAIRHVETDELTYYRRPKRKTHYDPYEDFFALETDTPPISGQKLPHFYKTIAPAQRQIRDLYSRHKRGGAGVQIFVQRWHRQPHHNHWTIGG